VRKLDIAEQFTKGRLEDRFEPTPAKKREIEELRLEEHIAQST